ncbi:MAG: hypothetical protein Q4D62_12925 [Planctomycetia bacterium]|nr:hypothetical protein [Planctomycetia bacterium]
MGIIEELDKQIEEFELKLLRKWRDDARGEIIPNAPREILEKAKRYDDYMMKKRGRHAYRNFVEPENLKEWDRIHKEAEELRKIVEESSEYTADGIPIGSGGP